MRWDVKGLASVAAGAAAVLSVLQAGGCAPAPQSGEPSPSYFQDAGKCSRQSQTVMKAKVRTGNLRTDMPLELGLNQEKYKACMENLGWTAPDPAKDPYFALAAKCRQSSMHSTETTEGGNVRLQAEVDATAYRECMRNKGAEGEVIVHPLEVK